jgi:transposase
LNRSSLNTKRIIQHRRNGERRFARGRETTQRELMAYLGLVPSEASTGDTVVVASPSRGHRAKSRRSNSPNRRDLFNARFNRDLGRFAILAFRLLARSVPDKAFLSGEADI